MNKNTLLKAVTPFLFLLLVTHFTQAQSKFGIVNSGELINRGIDRHDHEDYDEAIKYYNQVPENDTNYLLALTEKALTYYQKKDYPKTIEMCEKVLATGSDYDQNLYITLGSAYDDSGDSLKAIEVYDRGIKAFPKSHLILFNKAVTLQKMGKYDDAVETYKQVLLISPYHASSHFRLGSIAEQEGDLTRAMLCYNGFLVAEPTTERALNVLQMLDKMVARKYDNSKAKGINLAADGEDFGEIEQLIRKQLALNKNYKLESKADYPVNRQNQALFSYLVDHKGRKGFWENFYVPFFAQLYKEGHFEDYSYYILSSSDNEKIKPLVNKNKSAIMRYAEWQEKAYANATGRRKIDINGRETEVTHDYYKTGKLYGFGPYIPAEGKTPEKRTGLWQFFYTSGRLMSTGAFDGNGEQTGDWKFYHTNGKLKKETTFSAGKENGAYKVYYTNGNLKEQGTFVADQLDKEIKAFTYYGGLEEIHNFKAGVHQGKYEDYYPNGQLRFTSDYTNNKLTGQYKRYHPNGAVHIEGALKDDLKEGLFTSYYDDKRIELKKTYVQDKENGPYIRYYNNGAVKQEGTYKNGKPTGIWKSYWKNGMVEEITNYNDAGNEQGISQYFDMDGKMYYEADYKDGRLLQYKFVDKAGNVINETKLKGRQEMKSYYAEGALHYEGALENGKRSGLWKEYLRNGILLAEYNYDDGLLTGNAKVYYNNGKIRKNMNYKNGELQGEYNEYFQNGQLYKTCWYENGVGQGNVKLYTSFGVLDHTYTLHNNKQNGNSYIYDAEGRVRVREEYDKGYFKGFVFFDTTGKEVKKIDIQKEKVVCDLPLPTGQPHLTRTYINGSLEGASPEVYLTGKLESEGNFLNDERHGEWKWYNADNTPYMIRNYRNGSQEGVNENYDQFGKMRSKFVYVDGDIDSLAWLYYYNGNKKEEMMYWEGSQHGPTKYYGFNGEHVLTAIYQHGTITHVVYINGKGGKPDTATAPANGSVEAKYTNGKTAFIINFKNGEMNGAYKEFFDDGSPSRDSKYTDDYLEGERKTWYRNGKLRSVENYTFNDYNGLTTLYNENGTLKAELNYKHDNLHGPVKYYDGNGKLIAHYIFYNDKMIQKIL